MPDRKAIEAARRDKAAGKSRSVQAGESVREEIHAERRAAARKAASTRARRSTWKEPDGGLREQRVFVEQRAHRVR
jgi:hypothetical protein